MGIRLLDPGCAGSRRRRPCGGSESVGNGDPKNLADLVQTPAITEAYIFPNPSKGEFQLYHVVREGVEHVLISVRDSFGREWLRRDLSGTGGVANFSSAGASGLHFVSLYYDGILVETVKLSLTK